MRWAIAQGGWVTMKSCISRSTVDYEESLALYLRGRRFPTWINPVTLTLALLSWFFIGLGVAGVL